MLTKAALSSDEHEHRLESRSEKSKTKIPDKGLSSLQVLPCHA